MVVFGAKKCRYLSRSCKKNRPILKGCSIVAVALVIGPAVLNSVRIYEWKKKIEACAKRQNCAKNASLTHGTTNVLVAPYVHAVFLV